MRQLMFIGAGAIAPLPLLTRPPLFVAPLRDRCPQLLGTLLSSHPKNTDEAVNGLALGSAGEDITGIGNLILGRE